MLKTGVHQAPAVTELAQPRVRNEPAAAVEAFVQQALGNQASVRLASAEPAAAPHPAANLIAEDGDAPIQPAQLRRTEFLERLRASVSASAETALAGTGRTTADCPYLNHWFQFYGSQDTRHIARAIARYAPESAGAHTASELISVLSARAGRAVERWVATGQTAGAPDLPLRFLERGGAARGAGDPHDVRRQLGEGEALDSGVRSRMETAFGADFSGIRVHTDAGAGILSESFNARAFALGSHVAFGAGEYRPGTPVGDAVLAHELAHTLQQDREQAKPPQSGADQGLEADADRSATNVMSRLWNGAGDSLADIRRNVLPRLQSGLRLQRCPKEKDRKTEEEPVKEAPKNEPPKTQPPKRRGVAEQAPPEAPSPDAPVSEGPGKGIAACGATFTLENQVASSPQRTVDVRVVQKGEGHAILAFVPQGHVNYSPRITIHAGSDAAAKDYEIGLIQNVLKDNREFRYSSGGPLHNAIPMPIKDGASHGSGLYHDVFAEKPSATSDVAVPISRDGMSVSLSEPDLPGDGAATSLKDNPECKSSRADGTVTEARIQSSFVTWVGVRNRRTGCVEAIHHIEWNIDWLATIDMASGHGGIVRDAINVTVPDGDGKLTFKIGGKVPEDYKDDHKARTCD